MVIGPALTSAFTSMCRRLLQYLCTLNGSQLKTTHLGNTERYGTCKARNHTNMAMFDELRFHDSSLESPTISSHHPNTSLSIDTDIVNGHKNFMSINGHRTSALTSVLTWLCQRFPENFCVFNDTQIAIEQY